MLIFSDTAGELNLDRVGNYGDVYWVIDGGFCKRQTITSGLDDSYYFVECFNTAIYSVLNENADYNKKSLSEIIRTAYYKTVKELKTLGIRYSDNTGEYPSLAFAIVKFNKLFIEYAYIGDCFIMLQSPTVELFKTDETCEKYEDMLIDKVQETASRYELTMLDVRKLIHPWIVEFKNKYRNKEGGYWVLTPEEKSLDMVKYGTAVFEHTMRILIGTDGCMRAFKTYKLGGTSYFGILDLIEEIGLDGLYKRVIEIEKTDPQCKKYRRLSQHDDFSAIFLKFR